MFQEKAILGYWKGIRGLAGSLRLLLHYAGVEYEEKMYDGISNVTSVQEAAKLKMSHSGTEWYENKFKVGTTFPNIPYLWINGKKMSQNRVIAEYLGRTYGLDAKNDDDRLRLQEFSWASFDMFWQMILMILLTPKEQYPQVRAAYHAHQLPEQLQQISNFLADNEYCAGDYVTWADFLLYEYVAYMMAYAPDVIKNYENLCKFKERFGALPKIKEAMAKDNWVEGPWMAPMANEIH